MSQNEKVLWTDEIIEIYKNKWNWEKLSRNQSIPWNSLLVEKYKVYWDWKELSANPTLPWSFDFIKKYEELWLWKTSQNHFCKNFIYCDSISTNPGIFWDEYMFLRWQDKIDFWEIAWAGKIKESCIKRFYFEFTERRRVNFEIHKYSDWSETAHIYRTGWENFVLNKNFGISAENVNFYYNTKITLTYPVGNLANNGGYKTTDFRILEVLKTKPLIGYPSKEFDFKGWRECLFTTGFINESYWELLLKPFLTTSQIIEFLEIQKNTLKEVKPVKSR